MSGNRAAFTAIMVLLVISLAMNFYAIGQQTALGDQLDRLQSSFQSQLGSANA